MKKIIQMGAIILIVIGLLVTIVVAGGIGIYEDNIKKEKASLYTPITSNSQKITKQDLKDLPPLLQTYLIKTNIIGKPKYCNASFKQKGKIKTDLNKGWTSFTATQFVSSNNYGFIWKARALPMLIRDKFLHNKGEVKVSLLGLKTVVEFSSHKVDQSSLGRYFGELIWFPIGFLDSDIIWETIDEKTIKGTITKGDLSFIGFFYFHENGMIEYFKAKRYRDIRLENFIGRAENYKDYNGLLLPENMTAIWDLEEGELEYFKTKIIDYTFVD